MFSRFVLFWTLFFGIWNAGAQPLERPPHLETGRCAMPAVAVGSAIYVLGGLGNGGARGTLSDVERIETAGGKLVVSVLKPPLLPRYFHGAQAQGPFIYIFGGQAGAVVTPIVERLDTRDLSVELMAPLPMGVRTPASAFIDGKIYVVGGTNALGERLDTLFIYDIALNAWTGGANMPEAKECEVLGSGNTLLAIGGFNGEVAVRGVQSYDIARNTWSELPPLPTKISAHHGALIGSGTGDGVNNRVVLFGDYEEFGRVQIGNPRTGDWSRLELRWTPRRHHAALQLGPNIYVIGGNTSSSGPFFNEIEVFASKDIAP